MLPDYLLEQIKTIRNLCEVALLLRESNRGGLLPTILELIFEESQSMNDDNCVVRNESST